MSERGDIKNLSRYKQLFSYSGLRRHRNITPTDIDGLIDYNGNAFVVLEAKLINKDLDFGQKKAFENLINGLQESGRPACCLVFRHDCKEDEIIIVDKCVVSEMYYQGKWRSDNKRTVLQCIESFEKHCEKIFVTI